MVTGIRLLRLRAVAVVEAEILLPLAAGLLVVVAAVKPHLLAAVHLAAVAVELRHP